MELLTIITRTLQILSSFVLLVIVFSFIAIKVKSKRSRKRIHNFSKPRKDTLAMFEGISSTINKKPEVFFEHQTPSSENKDSKSSHRKTKTKVYAVYNPDSNPNFYLHNKLNWYKNFD